MCCPQRAGRTSGRRGRNGGDGGDCRDRIFIGVFFLPLKYVVHILGGVPILARRAPQGERGEAASVRGLEKRLEGRPSFYDSRFPRVELLERKDIRSDENADGIRNDLFRCERYLPNDLHLLALLNSVKKHFRRTARRHRAPVQCFIFENCHHVWLTIRILELSQNVKDGHGRVPTGEVGIVRHFELGRHCFVEHAEAGAVDVEVRKEVVLCPDERRFDCFRVGGGSPFWVDGRGAGVGGDEEGFASQ